MLEVVSRLPFYKIYECCIKSIDIYYTKDRDGSSPVLNYVKAGEDYISLHHLMEISFRRHIGPENLKKSRPKNSWNQINKKFFREIPFLAVLNFFHVQKVIFGHVWNCKKWVLVKKIFFVKLIYLISRDFLPGLV